ncbi:hypothetical protein E3N88_12844 [Mikania micrantha]|uniref:Uncharacterized protein n=1 Tax=Mikania micrantha TaxID=192012 RepID=A0A5N6P6Q4_9ASTR|nr:hypothetical protein E3N88_12844 [Mikania micrantha]
MQIGRESNETENRFGYPLTYETSEWDLSLDSNPAMVSIVINAAMYRACSSPHLATKEPSQLGTTHSLGTKQDSTFVGLNIEGQSGLITPQEQNHNKKEVDNDDLKATYSVRFIDE